MFITQTRKDQILPQGAQQLQELEANCGSKACSTHLYEISILAKGLGTVQIK